MFMGPLEVSKPWNTAGLIGVSRFLEKIWMIGDRVCGGENGNLRSRTGAQISEEETERLNVLLHKTIKKVTGDTATLNFNTAISQMMIYSNELAKLESIPALLWEPLVIMLGAYAPHLCEELWEKLGHSESVSKSPWPKYDEGLTVDSEATIVVQVNGKIRDKFSAAPDTPGEELEKKAGALPNIHKWIEGKTVEKIITVPGKLVNIVVK
jgi:leucyl-tRNA synthetase